MRRGSFGLLLFALSGLPAWGCASTRVSAAQLALSPAATLAPELATLSLRLALPPTPLPCPASSSGAQHLSIPRPRCVDRPFVRVYATVQHRGTIPRDVDGQVVCRLDGGGLAQAFTAPVGRKTRLKLVVGTWRRISYRVDCRLQLPAPRPDGDSRRSSHVGPWIRIDIPAQTIELP